MATNSAETTPATGRGSDLAGLEDADAPAGREDERGAVIVEWALDDAGTLAWDRWYAQETRLPTGRRRQKVRERSEHSRGALPPGAVWTLLLGAAGGAQHGEQLSHAAGGLLAILAYRCDARGRCWLRVPTLAHRARVRPRTVWRGLGGRTPERLETGLAGAGVLAYERRAASDVLDVQLILRGRDARDGLSARAANRVLDAADRAEALPHGAGAVLAVLLALADGRGVLQGVSLPTIAAWAGVSERQAERCTAALAQAGLLHRKRMRLESRYYIPPVA